MKDKKRLFSILAFMSLFLSVVSSFSTFIAVRYGSESLNTLFNCNTSKVIGQVEEKRFDSSWANPNSKGFYYEDKIISREANCEGMVLLFNERDALPLKEKSKISLFGHSCVDIVECGTGSGHIDTVSLSKKSYEAKAKEVFGRYFSINETLYDFYDKKEGSSYVRQEKAYSENGPLKVNEVPYEVYPDEVLSSCKDYSDAALIFLSRTGGENGDLYQSLENETENGGYLGLTKEEKDLLNHVTNDFAFKKVILVLNTANPLMMKDFSPYLDKIDACIYMGEGGSASLNALVELVVGNESFSGRLADTLAYDLFSHPSTRNIGKSLYEGSYEDIDEKYQGHYTAYLENIYVGYKYFETRYMDCFLNPNSNADSSVGTYCSLGSYDYEKEVAFPFGYGLSYSSFSYSDFKTEKKKDEINLTVKVKNEGTVESKEVVQVYLSKPYTDYDKAHSIEKSGVELVGFAKTKKLLPLESQTLCISIPLKSLTVYDSTFDNHDSTYGRYILEEGDYYLTISENSHQASNNILSFLGKDVKETSYMKGKREKSSSSFVSRLSFKKDNESYRISKKTNKPISNQLDNMDINRFDDMNHVTYLSRKDYKTTYPKEAKLTLSDKIKAGLAISFATPKNEPASLPKYSSFKSGKTKIDIDNGDLVCSDFLSAPLNEYEENYSKDWEEKWNQLLDQMSYEDQVTLVSNAYHKFNGVESIALFSSRQENGPMGITKRSESMFSIPNSNIKDWIYHSFPSSSLLAMTFNIDLAENIGEHISENLLYLGYNGIYGPCGNLHRTPFGGRNFEYYSEDSFLSLEIGKAQCKGIQSKGCIAFVKHFAFNDNETNRRHNGIWLNEQAARETYLSVFENMLAVANGVMNSVTRDGTIWTGMDSALQRDILRKEWGFKGIDITDWIETVYNSKVDALLAGTDCFDANSSVETSFRGFQNDPIFANRLRQACKTIIYNLVRTNAYNGLERKAIVVKIIPPWELTLYILISIFFLATFVFFILLSIIIFKERSQLLKSQA